MTLGGYCEIGIMCEIGRVYIRPGGGGIIVFPQVALLSALACVTSRHVLLEFNSNNR